jgi:anti-sigma factor RsiW
MASRANQRQPTTAELADLSALADGTLDPARRAEVEARIGASPDLSALYERERRVVAALHQARATDRAPDGLRARIEAARPTRGVVARRRIGYAGGLAGALAVVALALVLALPGGAPGSPSVSDAAALAARGPTSAPPAPEQIGSDSRLSQNVGEVYFPDWTARFGWRAVGTRTDRLGGHDAVTVYYAWHDKRVAYTIVAAPALPEPAAQRKVLNGVELRTLTVNGQQVVTWRESGDTCVLSGSGVSVSRLQKLAAWSGPTAGR